MNFGLDASTTTAGWAVTHDKKILDAGFIDLKPFETNRAKAAEVMRVIRENPHFKQIERINLETALSGFSGPSSRTVVIKLARFSAVLEYVLQDNFVCPVVLVGAMTARKQALGKARIKGVKPKVFVKGALDLLYDMKPWTTYNKIGNPDKRVEDVYDAVIISLYSK